MYLIKSINYITCWKYSCSGLSANFRYSIMLMKMLCIIEICGKHFKGKVFSNNFKVARFLSHLPTKYFSFCDEGARNVFHFGRRGSIIVHKKKTSYSKSSSLHRKWWILIFPKNTQKQLLLVLIVPCWKVCRLCCKCFFIYLCISLCIFVSHSQKDDILLRLCWGAFYQE